jgi:ParB family transcriptional regulator, chromosome partitioning protein
MKIEQKLISELIPYANNARTHNAEQITQIASSIKEFGFNNPILIDKDNGIIAGHGRLEAAKKLNLKEVPTISLEHLTDSQRKAYILADNRIAINSGWDTTIIITRTKRPRRRF